jgi:hypothetical protein
LNRIEAGDAIEGMALDDRSQLVVSWPAGYNATTVQPPPDDRRDAAVIWTGEQTEFLENEPTIELIQDSGSDPQTDPESEDLGTSAWWLLAAGVLALIGVAGLWLGRDRWWPEWSDGDTAGSGGRAGDAADQSMDLLSNEERVLQLLEERGGRVKQQEVVAELDWTEAKTSQVVTQLRNEDRIDVFRIGRENVLALPDEDAE